MPCIHPVPAKPTRDSSATSQPNLGRYANKQSTGNKGTKIKNHWATQRMNIRALANGLSVTIERFASPLNFDICFDSYCSMHSEDSLFGATHDAYSHKWQGSSQANPGYEAKDMEKALRWARVSAQEIDEFVLTAFVLPNCHIHWCKRLQLSRKPKSDSKTPNIGPQAENSPAMQSGT